MPSYIKDGSKRTCAAYPAETLEQVAALVISQSILKEDEASGRKYYAVQITPVALVALVEAEMKGLDVGRYLLHTSMAHHTAMTGIGYKFSTGHTYLLGGTVASHVVSWVHDKLIAKAVEENFKKIKACAEPPPEKGWKTEETFRVSLTLKEQCYLRDLLNNSIEEANRRKEAKNV